MTNKRYRYPGIILCLNKGATNAMIRYEDGIRTRYGTVLEMNIYVRHYGTVPVPQCCGTVTIYYGSGSGSDF
jgi:hypothetical protein